MLAALNILKNPSDDWSLDGLENQTNAEDDQYHPTWAGSKRRRGPSRTSQSLSIRRSGIDDWIVTWLVAALTLQFTSPRRMLSMAKNSETRALRSPIETKPLDVHSLSKLLSITMRSLASDCWIQPPSADSSWRCWPDTSPYSEFVRFPTSFRTSGLYWFQYWWLFTFWRPGWIAWFSKMIYLNQFQNPSRRKKRKLQRKALDLVVNSSYSSSFWLMLGDVCPSL